MHLKINNLIYEYIALHKGQLRSNVYSWIVIANRHVYLLLEYTSVILTLVVSKYILIVYANIFAVGRPIKCMNMIMALHIKTPSPTGYWRPLSITGFLILTSPKRCWRRRRSFISSPSVSHSFVDRLCSYESLYVRDWPLRFQYIWHTRKWKPAQVRSRWAHKLCTECKVTAQTAICSKEPIEFKVILCTLRIGNWWRHHIERPL